MYAVIETGGKQLKVEAGQSIFVEKLNVEAGEEVVFDKVCLLSNEGTKTSASRVTAVLCGRYTFFTGEELNI